MKFEPRVWQNANHSPVAPLHSKPLFHSATANTTIASLSLTSGIEWREVGKRPGLSRLHPFLSSFLAPRRRSAPAGLGLLLQGTSQVLRRVLIDRSCGFFGEFGTDVHQMVRHPMDFDVDTEAGP